MALRHDSQDIREVLVLFNPGSGIGFRTSELYNAIHATWEKVDGIDLYYQESLSPEDGTAKVRRAIERGVDTVLVVGGDGMVHTIGAELIGSDVRLGVLPTGSGNGFARHFDIPGKLEKAAAALLRGREMKVDVGRINGHPFLVTASLAWDADLVAGFEKSPIRGVAPYVFSGIYRYFTYEPQIYKLRIDGEERVLDKPLAFTLANLTQFGGGAKIAPNSSADDGLLSLVAVPHMDPLELVTKIHRLFDGTINKISEVVALSFRELEIEREREDPIQVDGELIDVGKHIEVSVEANAIRVLVPREKDRGGE